MSVASSEDRSDLCLVLLCGGVGRGIRQHLDQLDQGAQESLRPQAVSSGDRVALLSARADSGDLGCDGTRCELGPDQYRAVCDVPCAARGVLVLEELVDYTSDEELDAQSYFNRQRVPFFTVLVALPILSILRQMFLGELQLAGDLWFQIALIVAAGTGFFIRSRRGDTVLALVMLALIVVYLGVEYPNVSVEKSFELP